ncbi:MAG: FCD domain-containing protein [Burkholderiales bacterium]|nr:FCD domain-containing protein [Burkholderiales bacterium]
MSANEELLEDSLSHVAWQTLRNDIISGRLPPQARLRINKLRDSYGIGASPLREALSRLVSDGFVIAQERRGFSVAPMSLAEFRDLTDLRKLLEKEALVASLKQGDDAWEASVLGAYHRLSKVHKRLLAKEEGAAEEWELLNDEFHETLVSACTSAHLLRFRSIIYAYTQRYRRVCLSIHSVKRDANEEHKQLCDAALKRDTKRLCAIMDRHLEATYVKVAESGKLD